MGFGGVEIWTDGVPLIISSLSIWIRPNQAVSNENVCSTDGATHPTTQVPPKSKQLLVFEQQHQLKTCAEALVNLSSLLICINSFYS